MGFHGWLMIQYLLVQMVEITAWHLESSSIGKQESEKMRAVGN